YGDHRDLHVRSRRQRQMCIRDSLPPREVDVLAALGRGLSNQGIATDLYITEATAKTHVSRVLAKLGVATRMQAAIVARDSGLA
ncbi:response regulator transcription factor, partial [Cellulosimicrobium funkei]